MIDVPQEVKDLLHLDSCKKNIRITFPNGERTDVCNDLIVEDSVKFTERICSQDNFKFGMCESPVFECETVGVENIEGAEITVYCEVFCSSTIEGAIFQNDLMAYVYQIPYGSFTVQECKRQSDMQHRRIVAYRKSINDNDLPYICYNPYYSFINSKNYAPRVEPFLNEIFLNDFTKFAGHESVILDHNDDYYFIHKDFNWTGGYEFGFKCRVFIWDDDTLCRLSVPEYTKTIKQACLDVLGQASDPPSYYSSFFFMNRMSKNPNKSLSENLNSRYIYTYQRTVFNYQTSNIGFAVPFAVYYKKFDEIGMPVELYESQFRNPDGIEAFWIDNSLFGNQTLLTVERPKQNGTYWTVTEDSIDWAKYIEAGLELMGVVGQFGRGKNSFVNLGKNFGKNPSETLYPDDDNYPKSPSGGTLKPNEYSDLWYGDSYAAKFGAVVCEYKDTNNQSMVYAHFFNGFDDNSDASLYKTYDLSKNEIIRVGKWTAAQIQQFCEKIAANLIDINYIPCEIDCIGLPYVETGDTFEVLTASNDSLTTIVLNRTLSGELVLKDNYSST